jgi:hypothetical protein
VLLATAGTGAARHGAVDPAMPIPRDKLDWMRNEPVKTGSLST